MQRLRESLESGYIYSSTLFLLTLINACWNFEANKLIKIMKKIFTAMVLMAFLGINSILKGQTVTDIDGNVYQTVTIGPQVWMKENLRVTRFQNGDFINNITNNTSWSNQTIDARCYYNNDSVQNATIYGALYNWYAMNDNRNLCPIGWHVSDNSDWRILTKHLDNNVDTSALGWLGFDCGGKLKEAGTSHWSNPNTGATNISGFSALPAGGRDSTGLFYQLGTGAAWWAQYQQNLSNARAWNVYYNTQQVGTNNSFKKYGYSVRCVKSNCSTGSLLINDTITHLGMPVLIPILDIGTLAPTCNIISYQFDLTYNPAKIQYINNDISGTIASGGTVTVNSSTSGLLHISFMTTTALSGSGPILNLQFNTLNIGTSPLTITNFLYNTDTITDITNGSITAIGLYGDIDTNGYVQAYDAALALQYSVGLDPLPNSEPIPWENWRMIIANVDGVGSVTAIDASLILQHSAGLITLFPVESVKSSENPVADVAITQDNSELVFTSTGELYGLNIYAINGNQVIMNTPAFLVPNMMSATNINGSTYNIGLCTAYSPNDNTEIMRIPFTCTAPETLTFNMIINKTVVTKTFAVSCTVGINEDHQRSVNIFPNPAKDNIEITGINHGKIQILNTLGQVVYTSEITNTKTVVDISGFLSGIYTISIKTNNDIITKKLFIK